MNPLDWISIALMTGGAFFFLAGTAGLLRFPDVHSRLHALTKADNLGLGLLVAGLMLQAPSITAALKLLVIWILALVASALSCYLIAGAAAAEEHADD
jgi:multicomponent Na+:H+ antiporter subunit G